VGQHRSAIGAALLTIGATAWISAGVVIGTAKDESVTSAVPLTLFIAGGLCVLVAVAAFVAPLPTATAGRFEHLSEQGLGTKTSAVALRTLDYLAERASNHPGRHTDGLPGKGGDRTVTRTDPDAEYDRATLDRYRRDFAPDLLDLFDELERRGFVERVDRPYVESPEHANAAHSAAVFLMRLGDGLRKPAGK